MCVSPWASYGLCGGSGPSGDCRRSRWVIATYIGIRFYMSALQVSEWRLVKKSDEKKKNEKEEKFKYFYLF